MTDHDWTELDALIKHHYRTGEYGSCHLAMPTALYAALRARGLPKPESRPVWAPDLALLTGLPVVVDDEVPDGVWQVRTNEGRTVVRSGRTRTR